MVIENVLRMYLDYLTSLGAYRHLRALRWWRQDKEPGHGSEGVQARVNCYVVVQSVYANQHD